MLVDIHSPPCKHESTLGRLWPFPVSRGFCRIERSSSYAACSCSSPFSIYRVWVNQITESTPSPSQIRVRVKWHTVDIEMNEQCPDRIVTFMFYHCHFESQIQIQYYCILRIHACVPLKFPFLKKKSKLLKIFFLFASICGKKTVFCVIRNNIKLV